MLPHLECLNMLCCKAHQTLFGTHVTIVGARGDVILDIVLEVAPGLGREVGLVGCGKLSPRPGRRAD